jgi:gliding motility-associated-like protein
MNLKLLFLFLLFSIFCSAQENCDNGIDDDGDGKIDLNDSGCICNNSIITSLLPNPSFEEKTNCPQGFDDIPTINHWTKGTIPSPDYINKDCNVFNTIYTKNLENFPDGKGIVRAVYKNNKKEYIATKLSAPLVTGVNYQLTLNIATLMGIETTNLSKRFDFNFLAPTYVTLYGCNKKDNLPLYTTSDPSSFDQSWVEIGKVLYQPQTVWGEITISFIPNTEINAIMIGPEKTLPPSFNTDYEPSFLYDNLRLNTSENFGVTIIQSGNFCNNDLTLTANLNKTMNLGTTFQWYLNGIAINGATNKSYPIPSLKTNLGEYNVKVIDGNECFISSKLTVNNSIPNPSVTVVQPYCQDINGYIKVNVPGIEYSFDKGLAFLSDDNYVTKDLVWQTDANFVTKEYGKYYIQTRTSSGCISIPTIVTIDPPILLDRPAFSIVQPTCNSGGSITISTSASQFSFDNGTTWQNNATKTNLPSGNYLLKIRNSSGCESFAQSVFLFPFYIESPAYTISQPTCNEGGTINITTPASEYSFDNGETWTTNPTAFNLPNGYYNVRIKNENGCVSKPHIYQIYFNEYVNSYPEFKVNQPITCSETGIISFLKPSNKYSIDNGKTWQETPIFSNLKPSNYFLKTQNALGCESLVSEVKINFYLPKPTFTLVEASCATNGSITINSAAAFYSFNNGETWTTNPTASNLASGYYNIKIKNEIGCESDVEYAYLPPFYLDDPAFKIIDPNCETESKWSISITTPAASYSFDGGVTWSTNSTKSGLDFGTYFLKIKNSLGCESNFTAATINNTYFLEAPEFVATQPTCTTPGIVTITTPAEFYSFDDGATWSTDPNLIKYPNGSVSGFLRIKNKSGCISAANGFVLNPNFLDNLAYTIVQPTTCDSNATGSITITTSAALYSFDGGLSWSTNSTALNLPVGFKYQLKIKNAAGCESGNLITEIMPFKIKEADFIVTNPSCGKGGTITITTPAPFYSFDGGETWGTNPIATNLSNGFYYPKIKNEFGCISETINLVHFTEEYLTGFNIQVTQPTCESGNRGTITVDPIFDQYSFDGGMTWSQYNTATNLSAGNYSIKVKNNLGCESWSRVETLYHYYLPNPSYTKTNPICGTGGSISITTPSAFYSFDNGATWSVNPVAQNLEAGIYAVIIKNELGCESYPINIYVPPFFLNAPLYSITQPHCQSLGTISITTIATQYSIDNGTTWYTSGTFNNLQPGSYDLKIKNNLGCESNYSSVYLYNVNLPAQKPIISIQQPSSCTSSKGKISVNTNANQYSFDDGLTWSSSPTATDLDPGDYFIKIKNSSTGCPSPSVKVTINPPLDAVEIPNYVISQPISCANPFGTISITTVAFAYSFNNGLSWTTNATATNLPSGPYLIKIKNSAGCESESVTIQINLPTDFPTIPTYTINQPNCNNSKGKITINTVASEYSFDNGITWNTLAVSTFLNSGEYFIKIKNANGCISDAIKATIIPFINSILKPTINTPQTFCIQQNATISNIAITGQNIKWYTALANGTLLSNTTPLQNGTTYYASQTISGCESERIPVLINIQNTPAPTGNASQTFCSSQNPALENIAILGNAIKWYNSAGILLSNSTSVQDGVTYYASQTENNCESPNKLAVTISLINTLPANNYEELFCDDLNDGTEKVNLSDYNSKLISNTSGYTFSYYSTFLGAENQLTGNQITDFSNYKLALGDNKIYVRINSNTPCYAIAELKLTLVSKPIITIPDVVPICENNSITIDAGLGFDTYLWSTGATTSSILVANPGNYSVTVTTNYSTISCSSTKNFEVRKSNIATITSVEIQDWTDNQNTITVFTSGTGDFEYSIDGIHFQDSNQFSGLYSGEYTLHVRDKNGCGTATDEVFLLMYPKYFTPNGDGFNDTWNIKFSDLETNLTIKIFDRYGKLIQKLIQNNDWNGTMNGYDLPSDDYWFVINRAGGKEYKGHFSLKR